MRALILSEGSREWGSGHLSRCLSFAQYLKARGIEVSWLLKGDSVAAAFLTEGLQGELCDWFSPELLESRLEGCFFAIVDSYHAPRAAYEILFRRVTHCLWIDDDGRIDYPRGFVVNPNPPASLVAWCAANPTTRLLSGYAYQSLREEFWETKVRVISSEVRGILVMMGGTDPQGLMPRVIEVIRKEYPHAHIDALIPDPMQRSAWSWLGDELCTLHGRLGALEIRNLMEDADLAVSAAGQTLCETCCTGLPAIAVCVAENQRRHAEALARSGAIRLAGRYNDESFSVTLTLALRELSPQRIRQALSSAGIRLVDGKGTSRVIAKLLGWSQRLSLRPVGTEDSKSVWEISNQPSVREHSLNMASIPWKEHEAWFTMAITASDTLFLVVIDSENGNRVAGQLRYRLEKNPSDGQNFAIVSISFDSSIRGNGEATKILREGDARCFTAFPMLSYIKAIISPGNPASEKTFLRAGYRRQEGLQDHGGNSFLAYHKEVKSV